MQGIKKFGSRLPILKIRNPACILISVAGQVGVWFFFQDRKQTAEMWRFPAESSQLNRCCWLLCWFLIVGFVVCGWQVVYTREHGVCCAKCNRRKCNRTWKACSAQRIRRVLRATRSAGAGGVLAPRATEGPPEAAPRAGAVGGKKKMRCMLLYARMYA